MPFKMLNMSYIYKNRKSRNLQKKSRRQFVPDWDDNVNNPDVDGNVPLHWAAIDDSEEYLLYVLEQQDIQLNNRNRNGETAVLLAIKLGRPDSFVMELLKAGADITLPDIINQTCLHMSILNCMTDVTHELIKRGADINAQDNDECTPLHLAVNKKDLETVCMLLYYNADVTICCKDNNTPLMHALTFHHLEIAKTLIDYYTDFSCGDIYDEIASNIGVGDILKDEDSVENVPLSSANMYEDAQLLKLMWPKFDWRVRSHQEMSFLLMYLRFCNSPLDEWLESLYLMLESPVAYDLIEHYRDEMEIMFSNAPDIFLFSQLLHNFKYRKVAPNDRLTILSLCLYWGAEVMLPDINITYKYYGFNEEFEALLYCYNSRKRISINNLFNNFHFPMPTCILGLEDYSIETIIKLVENQLRYYHNQVLVSGLELSDVGRISSKDLVILLSFFSASYQTKLKLIYMLQKYSVDHTEVAQRLKTIPEVSTLLELTRNRVRAFVRQTHKITFPYQFHDAIKALNVPPTIKDVVRLKIPIHF